MCFLITLRTSGDRGQLVHELLVTALLKKSVCIRNYINCITTCTGQSADNIFFLGEEAAELICILVQILVSLWSLMKLTLNSLRPPWAALMQTTVSIGLALWKMPVMKTKVWAASLVRLPKEMTQRQKGCVPQHRAPSAADTDCERLEVSDQGGTKTGSFCGLWGGTCPSPTLQLLLIC